MGTIFLTKFLAFFIYPLGTAIFVGGIALTLTFTRWSAIGQVLLGVSLGSLWIASTPVLANWLNWRLESQFPPMAVEVLPQKEVVVVLGGGALGQPFPPRVAADLGAAADRIIHAMRIYRAGKAPIIVVSAGNLPCSCDIAPEAQLIADFMAELGVPRSAMVLETEGRTTRENATNTAVLFKERGWKTALLVTSGAHMPRALAAFQKAGLDVTPAATDIHAGLVQSVSLRGMLPTVGALAGTTSAIKEMIGLLVYRYRGWA
jgi:uncharacterized SAM-binding protein YcdF (DUF218 family)